MCFLYPQYFGGEFWTVSLCLTGAQRVDEGECADAPPGATVMLGDPGLCWVSALTLAPDTSDPTI